MWPQLSEKDDEHKAKLRSLRQQYERMQLSYERRLAKQTERAPMVRLLALASAESVAAP